MRKTTALATALFILLAVLVMIPQQATASRPDGMVVVYVSVPDDWEYPCLWAWDDAGNGVFSAWPGGEVETDPNNEGWYFIYMPNWANNIIVNANEGSIQTDALQTEGKDVWITVASPDDADVSFDAKTTGSAPEYVERIAIHARVPSSWENPGLWAWSHPDGTNVFSDWPGGEMRSVADDWYRILAPSWLNSLIINANGGTVQTEDFKELDSGKDIWIVVAGDSSAELFYENPDFMVPNITVRAIVPEGWENPHLWAWSHPDGTNAFASWPGEPFTLNGDWYEISLPGWVNSMIVNANGGSIQTGDMKELEDGKDIWIVVTNEESYEYSYEAIELPDTVPPPPPPPTEPPVAPTDPPTQPAVPEPDSGDNTTLWIVISVVAAIIVAVVIVLVVKKKK